MEQLLFSLVWGQLSTEFFFRSWISFLGILCCVIALLRNRLPMRDFFSLLFSRISETIFFSLLLMVGFYVFYVRFSFGKTNMEVVVFLISATVRLIFVLRKIPKAINDNWSAVNMSDDKNTDL